MRLVIKIVKQETVFRYCSWLVAVLKYEGNEIVDRFAFLWLEWRRSVDYELGDPLNWCGGSKRNWITLQSVAWFDDSKFASGSCLGEMAFFAITTGRKRRNDRVVYYGVYGVLIIEKQKYV